MRHKFQLAMVCIAWFMATGSQWDLVQVIAWGRMFAGYAQEMSFSVAAEKTLTGPACELCRIARDGREDQQSHGDQAPLGKVSGKAIDLCLVAQVIPVLPANRDVVMEIAAVTAGDGRDRAAPPSPPPRA